jgi:hypothetical protein
MSLTLKEALRFAVRDCWLLSFDVFNANGPSFKVVLVRLMPCEPEVNLEKRFGCVIRYENEEVGVVAYCSA